MNILSFFAVQIIEAGEKIITFINNKKYYFN